MSVNSFVPSCSLGTALNAPVNVSAPPLAPIVPLASVVASVAPSAFESRRGSVSAGSALPSLPDETTAVAAVDRLVHHGTILEMNVESYRHRAALENSKRKRGRPARIAPKKTPHRTEPPTGTVQAAHRHVPQGLSGSHPAGRVPSDGILTVKPPASADTRPSPASAARQSVQLSKAKAGRAATINRTNALAISHPDRRAIPLRSRFGAGQGITC